MVAVKFHYSNITRRVDVEPKVKPSKNEQDAGQAPPQAISEVYPSLKQLRKVARNLFQAQEAGRPQISSLPEEFVLKYTDEEGDLITVASNKEVEEAFRCMTEKCGRVPKFFIYNKNSPSKKAVQVAHTAQVAVVNAANEAYKTINNTAGDFTAAAIELHLQLQEQLEKMQLQETVKGALEKVSDETKKIVNEVERSVRQTVQKVKNRKNSFLNRNKNNNNADVAQEEAVPLPAVEEEPILEEEQEPQPRQGPQDEEEEPLLKKDDPREINYQTLDDEEDSEQELASLPEEEDEEDDEDDLIDDPIELQLRQLADMGFVDREKNRALLVQYEGDIVATIRDLLDNLN